MLQFVAGALPAATGVAAQLVCRTKTGSPGVLSLHAAAQQQYAAQIWVWVHVLQNCPVPAFAQQIRWEHVCNDDDVLVLTLGWALSCAHCNCLHVKTCSAPVKMCYSNLQWLSKLCSWVMTV
jgi:hypothetical protein